MISNDNHCRCPPITNKIKQWKFLRKLNKTIKRYGAKASIKKGILYISMRNRLATQPYSNLKSHYNSDNDLINKIIKEIKIMNVKEAY